MGYITEFIRSDKLRDNNMKNIVKMVFGSQLYGTSNENSDKDFKGIFMPSKEQIFLGKIPKSLSESTKKDINFKNTADDIDTEMYSLQYFIHLACEGETVALDMLHAPENMLVESSSIWKELVQQRHFFYTKNLKAFVGYARRQASKYGIKGSRLNDAKRVLNYINSVSPGGLKSMFIKLQNVWSLLPEGEHIFKHPPDVGGIRMYEVCGRKIGETASLEYLSSVVTNFYNNYGARAKEAAENKGVDWKAVSHALRAAYQVKQILVQKTVIFPLPEAEYLRKVKEGKLHYQNEVAPMLDKLIEEVEELSLKSDLPPGVDRKYWDKWLVSTIGNEVYYEI